MQVRFAFALAGIFASLVATSALATTPSAQNAGPQLFDSPSVVVTPTPEQFAAAYPRQAHGDGLVNLSCGLTSGGRLNNCQVVSETPARQGFGQAALSLSRLYRLPMDLVGDQASTVTIRLEIKARQATLPRVDLTMSTFPNLVRVIFA